MIFPLALAVDADSLGATGAAAGAGAAGAAAGTGAAGAAAGAGAGIPIDKPLLSPP